MQIAGNLIQKAVKYGIAQQRIYIDPLDKDLIGAILVTKALIGKDPYCRKFANAYRQGEI